MHIICFGKNKIKSAENTSSSQNFHKKQCKNVAALI